MGGGVCGAIFKAAGALELQAACDKLAPIKTGEAVITPGFGLRAKFIIHASGPVYSQRNKEQNEQLLRAAYTNSLKRAVENNCISIAFPLISSGIYGYPKDEALQVATSAIQDFLKDYDLEVTLVVFDKSSFAVSRELLGAVESYIDEHFFEKHQIKRRQLLDAEKGALEEALEEEGIFSPKILESMQAPLARAGIDDFVDNLDEPFSMTLLRLIDAKGKTDVEIYKRANLDRKLFSKIRTSRNYMPSKRTAVGLAIALELSLDETEDLLERAGYALSHSQKFDVIVEYFIVSGKYDIFEINEVLFKYDQPLLGG
jgi:O-acetyl-ADP-ribose deacetylase (regulator of RNase III)